MKHVLILLSLAVVSLGAAAQPQVLSDALKSKAQQAGMARVIVSLVDDTRPLGVLTPSEAQAQVSRSTQVRDAVIDRLTARSVVAQQGLRRFDSVPAFAATVTPQDLQALAEDPEVRLIEEDLLLQPALQQSIAVVHADDAWLAGYEGAGQVVAVLDTGVDKNHPFLSGKVVSEACYSTNITTSDPGVYVQSLCPGGATSSTASNSGLHCTGVSGCDHGTHVAGIAAGSQTTIDGVARGAGLIAMQVFSRFSPAACGSASPCISAYTSDIIAGLERVYALRNSHQIASVNLSLGGGRYFGYCDGTQSAIKQAIDNLKSVGIATVIASGNDGFRDSVSSPACVSTAITVGSTTKADALSSFSNSASMIDVLAPGSSILSSVPGTTYAYKSGTSMATPHVAGAWAVLKSMNPDLTVDEIEAALKATGWLINEPIGNVTRARIDVHGAVQELDVRPFIDTAMLYSDTARRLTFWGINDFDLVAESSLPTHSPGWTVVGKGDFFGDGGHHVLVQNLSTRQVGIWQTDQLVRIDARLIATMSEGWVVAGIGDFNGDGMDDILVRHPANRLVGVWLMNGFTRMQAALVASHGQDWTILGAGDLNGDGRADIIVQNAHTRQLGVWFMDGAVRTSAELVAPIMSAGWQVLGATDFNGDGRADLLVYNASMRLAGIWTMNGATRTSAAALPQHSPGWHVAGVGEYNGDGMSDIIFVHEGMRLLGIWRMNGTVRTAALAVGHYPSALRVLKQGLFVPN